ncbi:MAG: tetratricopeptide repeat protein [Planctomycetota bacterium]|jgi:TolA-binding protein
MRYAGSLALALGVCLAVCAGEPQGGAAPAPAKEVQEKREQNRRLYNGVYQSSLLLDPKRAQREFSRAQDAMEKANPGDRGDASIGAAMFQRGYLAVEAGQYRQAVAIFEELVRRYPTHAYADDALYQIGLVYQKHLKDYDKAAAAYSRLARLYNNRETAARALWNVGNINASQNKVQVAVEQWKQAEEAGRKSRYRRGQTSVPNDVEQQAARQVAFVHKNPVGDEQLGIYFQGTQQMQEGNVPDAAENFSKIQKQFSNSKLADDADFALAECRRREMKLGEAARLYAQFIAKYPGSEYIPLAKFRLAELKRVGGDEDGAVRLYREVQESVAQLVEKRMKENPNLTRADISPELRQCLEISRARTMEMTRVRQSR